MIRGIHLTSGAGGLGDTFYNTGKYEVSVKTIPNAEHIKSVSIYAVAQRSNAINMLMCWGFANTEEEVTELTETLLAACELSYSTAKGE